MTPQTVALLGGVLFLLLAIVGGGFSIKEITMPRVPTWARVACLLVGMVLVVPFLVDAFRPNLSGFTVGALEPGPPAPPQGETVIYSDSESYASNDGIEVSGLLVTGERNPPAIGDRIRIQFSLENVGSNAVTFEETFIGARNPAEDNKDFGHENTGAIFSLGDVVKVSHSIIVDVGGLWEFWPCYTLRTGGEETFCPDEWRAFQVPVGQ